MEADESGSIRIAQSFGSPHGQIQKVLGKKRFDL
jgi:hypothetical protein